VIFSIPNEWKNKLTRNKQEINKFKVNLHLNVYLKTLIKDKKGSRTFYDSLVNSRPVDLTCKWHAEIGNISNDELKTSYKNMKQINEIKLKDFQFKINHKILVTKTFLFKINKSENDVCSYCNAAPETIYHIFCECSKVKNFIQAIKSWLQNEYDINIPLIDKPFLLSTTKESEISQYMCLLLKYYIYKSKFRENCRIFLSLPLFKIYLKQKLQCRIYILQINKLKEALQTTISNILINM
jgi:hypothetical protein